MAYKTSVSIPHGSLELPTPPDPRRSALPVPVPALGSPHMQPDSPTPPFERLLAQTALELMAGLRAVVLQGPRQAGKTTLARQMAERLGARLISLDDPAALEAVRLDPTGFLEAYPRPLCLDEFQRGGETLVLALKS